MLFRSRDARMLAECGGVVRDTPRQDILPALTTGLLSDTPCSARGSLFPQPRLADGAGSVLMDHRFGHGWRLVLAPGLAPSPWEGEGWGGGSGARVTSVKLAEFDPHPNLLPARDKGPDATELDGVVAAWMDRHACTAALVRPDHYVFGTATDAASLTALLAEFTTALSTGATPHATT